MLTILRGTPKFTLLPESQVGCFQSPWLLSASAAFSVLALAPNCRTMSLVLAGSALLGHVGVYGSYIHMTELKTGYLPQQERPQTDRRVYNITHGILPLILVLAILLKVLLFPEDDVHFQEILLPGIYKAAHWLIVIWLVS